MLNITPAVAIAGAGLFVTLAQLWLGRRKQRLDATFRLIELMQEQDSRNARFELKSIVDAASEAGFESLSPIDRAKLSSVALFFGLAGFLAKRKRIDLDVFLDAYGYSVALNHQRLKAYAVWRSQHRSTGKGSLWKDFDWLAAQAEGYIDPAEPFKTP